MCSDTLHFRINKIFESKIFKERVEEERRQTGLSRKDVPIKVTNGPRQQTDMDLLNPDIHDQGTVESSNDKQNNQKVAPELSTASVALGLRFENKGMYCCYANAATNLLLTIPHLKPLIQMNGQKRVLGELKRYLAARKNAVLSTKKLRGLLGFNSCNQEDAAEFLNLMLSDIQEGLPTKYRSDHDEIFSTIIQKRRDCLAINSLNCPPAFTELKYFILRIPIENAMSLEESLRKLWTQSELLEWRCPNVEECRYEYGFAIPVLNDIPKVLILQLERFNRQSQKIGDEVNVPPFIQPLANGKRYNFLGSIIHSGSSMEHGHYTTLIHTPETGNLLLCDDSKAPRQIHVKDSKLGQSYILCYAQDD